MKKQVRNQSDILEDLVKITTTILSVYKNLIQSRMCRDKEQYESGLEDLKLCLELENKLYQELDPTWRDSYQVFQKASKYLEKKEFLDKELILQRIELYLCNHYLLNPFLSIQENEELALSDNTISILNQYTIDFLKLKSYLLELLISELKDDLLREYFLTILYEDVFQYKVVEWELLSREKIESPELNGKYKCILFGQDENLVEDLYFQKSDLLFWNMIKGYVIDKNYHDFVNKNNLLISMYAALYLLDDDSLEKIYFEFCRNYYVDSLECFDRRVVDVVSIFEKLRGKNKQLVKFKGI